MPAQSVLDAGQKTVALRLEALAAQLRRRTPRASRLFGRKAGPPRGIYLWGDVGRGKTLLMDRFFEKVEFAPKRRVHFNAFMVETHARLHDWRSRSGEVSDLISPVARAIASEAKLLCFDEFQVRDVADAMILGRLFDRLLSCEVVVVATSNTPPRRLYEDGLNRQLFLPFIARIEEELDVVEMPAGPDYRLGRMAGLEVYVTPLGSAADEALDRAWSRLTNDAVPAPDRMAVLGRTIVVPRAAGSAARFSFDELCSRPLAAADYLAIARRYAFVVIDRIPRLTAERCDEATRFAVLVDTLYDEDVKLICSAAAPPDVLCAGSSDGDALRRTASRLMEMQSLDYLRRARSPDRTRDHIGGR